MKKSKSDKNHFRSISNIFSVDKNFRSKYDHSRTQKQNFEKFRDKNIRNSPFEMEIRIIMAFEWVRAPSTHSKFELVREFVWRGTKNCSNYRKFRITEVRIVESDLLEFPKENWRWLRFRSNYRKIRITEVRISESLLYILFANSS